MASKKGYRKSMPAQVNSTTLSPSRRSPRVPSSPRAINETPTSTKSLDVPSPVPSDDSFNIRFYNPKTPPSTTKTKNASPDVPSTRRRTFQARPSRLSTVYTPAVDTTNSSQGSRRSRRTTISEVPNNQFSDQDLPESVGSTGWTYDQYMGGRDYDEAMAQTSPSASSRGTRSSARIRKPTTRAIEAMASKPQPRRKKATAPTSTKQEPEVAPEPAPKKVAKKPQKAQEPPKPQKAQKAQKSVKAEEPQKTQKPLKAQEPQKAQKAVKAQDPQKPQKAVKAQEPQKPQKAVKAQEPQKPQEANKGKTTSKTTKNTKTTKPTKPTKVTKTTKTRKTSKAKKPALKRVDISVDQAGKHLYELAVVALGPDFVPPPDAEKMLADMRNQYLQGKIDESSGVQPANETQTDSVEANRAPESKGNKPTLVKFKKMTPPQLATDGWASAGRVNDSGEELVLTPPGHSPYRSPHTYGDDSLPMPPLRSRSDQQINNDDALGFPPLIGDRNIPFDGQAQFLPEDVTEETARAQARRKATSGTAAPATTDASKKSRGRKRRLQESATDGTEDPGASAAPTAAPVPIPVPTEDGERKPKRRRGEPASVVASPTRKAAATKRPASRSAKSAVKAHAPGPAVDAAGKPKFQRLHLKLKPAPDGLEPEAGPARSRV
ncbi:uncharacterized protein N7459_005821 [Penicillium hispanicum]|uniref:uncharacterized protein n=1 Tax=Penicillium hispanicum TaxID=1080232 RepID=UPI002541680E|nr:uncharacterized protein N7459_005821 [Penicillium hispanicum]KAJ5579836.1 hypothetical protein N7459_005821 [Penicillium hispanicum]